jgi:hypothetical protein
MRLSEAMRRNTELEAALVARDETIAQLQAQIRQLPEQLGQNSTNSSKPPSSEGPAVQRPLKERRTGRRRGAQRGHKGQARALVPIEQVDEVIDCVPETGARCGLPLVGLDPSAERHQVVDIPEPRQPVIWRKGSFGTDSPAGSRFVKRHPDRSGHAQGSGP